MAIETNIVELETKANHETGFLGIRVSPNGKWVAKVHPESHDMAAELVRRWNAHEGLVAAMEDAEYLLKKYRFFSDKQGYTPTGRHGESIQDALDALAAARGEGE